MNEGRNRRDLSVHNNIEVWTHDHPYEDSFRYIISDHGITIIRSDVTAAWWVDLHIEIFDTITQVTRTERVGPNSCVLKKIRLNTGLVEKVIPVEVTEINIDNVKPNLSPKVLFCNTITPEDIYLDKTDIVIAVTSIIHVSTNKLEGVSARSLVSPVDRYDQTLRNLKTIRCAVPNAKIFLLETSIDMPDNEVKELSTYCDYMIRYVENNDCNYYAHEQPINKGLGEMYVLIHLGELIRNKQFKVFCKICGRYRMTSKFDINTHLVSSPTFKFMEGNGRLNIIVFSNFYSIPKMFFDVYLEHTKVWLKRDRKEPIEHILTMFVESLPEITLLTTLNIRGIGASHGFYNDL